MKAFIRPGDLRKTTKLVVFFFYCKIEEVYSSLNSLEERVLVEDDYLDMIKNLTLA